MQLPAPFLKKKSNYRKLALYQKAESIYDMTFFFAHKYLDRGDRTIDQMIQAARSGKQNIAEGAEASLTSTETEIKLTNVARASLQELLIDYEDYIRTRRLQLWNRDDTRAISTLNICRCHNDSAFFMNRIEERSPEAIANIVITLLHQVDYMLERYLERLQCNFVANGGLREQMARARKNFLKDSNK